MKKNKKRVILVLTFLILFAIYLFINIRGEYLEILGIGEKYINIFKTNLQFKAIVILINFIIIYIATYITTRFIKRGLKIFFQEDKKEMPKLPNKSISLIISIVLSIFICNILTEKSILAVNSRWFGINDPVFNMDLGYFIFQKPFIELLVYYFIGIMIGLSIYIAVYYIIAFNMFFDKGINGSTLKKNTFIKQLTVNLILIAIGIATITLIKTPNILFNKFLNLNDETNIYGAGITDVTIKLWGYRVFAVVIVICTFMTLKYVKKKDIKKVFIWLGTIPAYLIVLFIIMIGFKLVYVNPNEFDNEKKYIEYNIKYTKNAYNINIEEVELESSGTITSEDIDENEKIINNINLLNKELTLTSLKEYQTNLGYYTFNNTNVNLYNIDEEPTLVYFSPREIVNNESRTYKHKTYEYTHGYGAIITSATSTDETGNIEYIQKSFEGKENKIKIVEPRIYFGLQTNHPIITNTKNKTEYDYPIGSSENKENVYQGTAGLSLNFIDKLILGIKEGNFKLAFSSGTTQESKIITNRNIIQRAKKVLPYLLYDENPYLIATDEGKLVWVLDAYTVSDNYPYSQSTTVEINGERTKINYIRNSIKILIDSYNGTMEFYITDRTDPIAMAYEKMYPSLFEASDKQIPEDIQKQIVYPEFLYKIQSEILKQYHNMTPEVLYRGDDIWDLCKENSTKVTTLAGTDIKPYYTMVQDEKLGLIIPYTNLNKQNIISYLVGTYDSENKEKLKLYKFNSNSAILGTMQLDTLIEQDETIAAQIKALNITGTNIIKNIRVIPINNTLLYVEPIYQVKLNEETQVPVLKKVVVASGNKIAIGDTVKDALLNLLSQQAVSIEVQTEDMDELILQIINANSNLEQSNISNNWEMIGKDMSKLQELIKQLEEVIKEKEQQDENNVIQVENTID